MVQAPQSFCRFSRTCTVLGQFIFLGLWHEGALKKDALARNWPGRDLCHVRRHVVSWGRADSFRMLSLGRL
jgi:hypothetical protein